MDLRSYESLQALSPLDGRYRSATEPLRKYFSEEAWIHLRCYLEVEYLIHLSQETPLLTNRDCALTDEQIDSLRVWCQKFNQQDACQVKEIEQITKHEIKAVEYFLKGTSSPSPTTSYQLPKFPPPPLSFLSAETLSWIHWGLTSQDINSTVYILSTQRALDEVLLPELRKIHHELSSMGVKYGQLAMLSHTHGQPASSTTLGKELLVFWERLRRQLKILEEHDWSSKFGGAVGNFNAHQVAAPEVDWASFGDSFLNNLNLRRMQWTTQIDHYDHLAEVLDALKRTGVILIDLCRDIWQYISLNYFGQRIVENEVGSSTMPHKVNPIDFENAEGNLMLANSLLTFLGEKLPISRLQRDLSDSTVIRNLGVAFGHFLLASTSLLRGLAKLEANPTVLAADLDRNWVVVAEAYQTILKTVGMADGYERLKELTRTARNKQLGKEEFHQFVEKLPVTDEIKEQMKKITPENYLGIIPERLGKLGE